MRTKILATFLVVFCLSAAAHARGPQMIRRGGLGFLFPDHNSFVNPAQFANSMGIGIQAAYSRTSPYTSESLVPSLVFGNGKVGLGAFWSRSGTTMATSKSDTAGVGAGFSMFKGRVTAGASWSKLYGSNPHNNGDLEATLNFNPAGGKKGFAIGAGYTNVLATGVSGITAGIGYIFKHNNFLEAGFTLPSLKATSVWAGTATLNLGGAHWYFGAQYALTKAGAISQSSVMGRLGAVLGHSVDLSATITYILVKGAAMNYGGTLRFAF